MEYKIQFPDIGRKTECASCPYKPQKRSMGTSSKAIHAANLQKGPAVVAEAAGPRFIQSLFFQPHCCCRAECAYFVAQLSGFISKRFCIVRAGEQCGICFVVIVFRFPCVRLCVVCRRFEGTGPIKRLRVSIIRYPVDLNGVIGDRCSLPGIVRITVCLLPFTGQIGRRRILRCIASGSAVCAACGK